MTGRAYRNGYADDNGRECTGCLTYKPWDKFYKQANGLNGHMPRCKQCRDEERSLRAQGADLHERPKVRV